MEVNFSYLSTIALTLFTGVLLVILSKRLKIPAIVLLLTGGILLGPQFIGLINTSSLGKGLQPIISICVAIILFDGGLTLNPDGYKKAPKMIVRLLTIGVLTTWLGSAFLINYLFHYSISFSLLCSSLIIVTGPTVISPILRNVKVKEKIHQILNWESVLIDPIGVFIAILCFEWYSDSGVLFASLESFGLRLLIGIVIGFAGGFLIYLFVHKKWVPDEQLNIFVFSSAILLYGISDYFVHDSGILTVVISGFILGWKKPDKLKRIKEFKSEISELAIGTLFILLAANLDIDSFLSLGKNGLVLILLIVFAIRPLNIFFSSIKTSLTFKEGMFLAWVSPRGVVAASMASLFALKLSGYGDENAKFLEIFTFSIIIVTVVIQGSTSNIIAKLLRVKAEKKKGWLIIGAHEFSRQLAGYLENTANQKCYFIDTNYDYVKETEEKGFTVFQGNAMLDESIPDEVIYNIDYVFAITDNSNLNYKICDKWFEQLKKGHFYYWSKEKYTIKNKRKKLYIQPAFMNLKKPSEISYEIKEKKLNLSQVNKLNKNDIPLLFLTSEMAMLFSVENEIVNDQVSYLCITKK